MDPAEGDAPSRRDWRRAATGRFLATLALAVAGLVLVAIAGGTAEIIGWTVLGVACTVAVSLVFLEVGAGEDRARERRDGRRGGIGATVPRHDPPDTRLG